MRTNMKFLLAMVLVAFTAAVAVGDTYTWSGAVDNYWLTSGNWSSGGVATEKVPGNTNTVVFSQTDDLTVVITNASNKAVLLQAMYVAEGAGRVTIRQPEGWSWPRAFQFRRIGSGSERPAVTNFINKSSHPVEFLSPVSVVFANSWGDFAIMPGAVYNGDFSMTRDDENPQQSAKGWLLAQDAMRTDNDEMNRSVFKGKTTFERGFFLGTNHEAWVIGNNASLTVIQDDFTVEGKLVLDETTITFVTMNQDGGEVAIKGNVTMTANSISGNVFTFSPVFSMSGYDVESDTTLKIAKSGLASPPTLDNFKLADYSGITLKDGVSADEAFTFEIDDTSDEYYIVTPKLKSLNDLASMTLTAAYAADDAGNMTNATQVVLQRVFSRKLLPLKISRFPKSLVLHLR